MARSDVRPLVTIGIPTYNRPQLLDVALKYITDQTYQNLDILISDNASTNPDVTAVMNAWARRDHRIRIITQKQSLGASGNFTFVLSEARGPFFLWMADDDRIEPWHVERCLAVMDEQPGAVLVAPEAQYFGDGNQQYPFLPEGAAFREPVPGGPIARMEHMLRYNYGNLVYGLFRTEALVANRSPQRPVLASLNEIGLLLEFANAGQVLTIPSIGLHKQAPLSVYKQVRWEVLGGKHPAGVMLSLRSILGTWKYHQRALKEIYSTIDHIGLTKSDVGRLKTAARNRLHVHFMQLVVGRKPPQFTGRA